MEIRRVGVVGCGFMGSGITQTAAQAGYSVTVSDVNSEILNKGLSSIKHYLNRAVEKGKMSNEEKNSTLNRITTTTNLQDFSNCDLIIEVVPEDLELKKTIFKELDKVSPKNTILATNTSSFQ